MSMLTHIKSLAEAIGADIKALRNDSRFSDAREWSEDTVSKLDAEAGTSTARRAWTAQRVRQAINAWWQLVTSGFGRNFIAASNEQAARNVLQLGTAATATLTTSPTDGTAGRVLRVGDGGWMGRGGFSTTQLVYPTSVDDPTNLTRVLRSDLPDNGVSSYATSLHFSAMDTWGRLRVAFQIPRAWVQGGLTTNGTGWTSELYHTGNTTKNPDGTLKASSPVINLYTNKHDLHNESQFGATPTVTRLSKGVYEIAGTLGLRSEGWYLDTPSDRNGNKYFNVEWTQNVTPEAVDGVVETYRDDVVVTIETFERVWNPATGVYENGVHADINDMQDRFVQLRFNEIKPADIDDGEYMPPAEGSEPDAPRVPRSVTMRQARLVLLGAGLLDQVGNAIDMLEEPQRSAARIEWDYASKVDRDSQMVMLIGDALNLNSAELDALFIAAHAID